MHPVCAAAKFSRHAEFLHCTPSIFLDLFQNNHSNFSMENQRLNYFNSSKYTLKKTPTTNQPQDYSKYLSRVNFLASFFSKYYITL